MINDIPGNQNESNIMNPPEPSQDAGELKEKILHDLDAAKKEGKHREWYEHLLIKWLKNQVDSQSLSVMKTCLCENPVENYSDIDYVIALLKASDSSNDYRVTRLVRLVREITKRKLILDRSLPQVNELFSWDNRDYSEEKKASTLSMAMETYAATTMLLAESISLVGETQCESYDLKP